MWEANRPDVETALVHRGSKARNERGALSINEFKQIGENCGPCKWLNKRMYRHWFSAIGRSGRASIIIGVSYTKPQPREVLKIPIKEKLCKR